MSSHEVEEEEEEEEEEEKEEEEVDEFELQLRLEEQERQAKKEASKLPKGLTYTDTDGTVMEWDSDRQAYFPKIDADFIAQYQINYGASQSQHGSHQGAEGWDKLTDEEKQRQYDEYWSSYYQAYSKEQPKMPRYKIDEDGYEVEVDSDEEKKEEEKKKAANQKKKEKDAGGDDGKKTKEGDDKKSDGGDTGKEGDKDKEEWDPTSDKHYEYNLFYYGKEYADTYRQYYRDNPDEAALPDFYAEQGKERTAEEAAKEAKEEKKGKKKGEKRKEPAKEEGWFDIDPESATHKKIYVTGLPADVSEEEFQELCSKCGMIMLDPFTHRPKVKLYRDAQGQVKGDGLCTYIKPESVELALNILDGYDIRGKKISVEKAKFELKGAFDPKKKKKKLSNKQKQKLKEKQEKLFDWRPDKNPYERAKHERVVILKHMFDVAEFDKDPALINELRTEVREECAKFGDVSKVVLYDRNPEGVISVMFALHEEADKCIAALNGRWYGGKRITAAAHDGKTKYEIEETEEEKAKRLADWDAYLASGGDTTATAKSGDAAEKESGAKKSSSSSAGSSGVLVEDVEEPDGVDTGGVSEATTGS